MNFAQENQGSSRLTGFGIVILIHIFIIWALASGLARKVVEVVKGPIDVKVIEEVQKPPPPPEKIVPPPPKMDAPPPPFVPPPEVQITAPPPVNAPVAVQSNTPPPVNTVAPTPVRAPTPAPPAPVAAKPAGPVKAGVACTKMGKPDASFGSWSGEALFKAVFSVKAGRVDNIEVQVLRNPGDRKAQRAMINAISSALKDTYECPGDHANIEQEFSFKID